MTAPLVDVREFAEVMSKHVVEPHGVVDARPTTTSWWALPPGEIVLGEHARVEFATEAGRAWLDHLGVRSRLFTSAAATSDSLPDEGEWLFDGIEMRIVRLHGVEVPWALVHVRPCGASARDERTLTPAQHRVAEYAAAGATLGEIARAVGCSYGTAKVHLAAVYRRLGVRTRVALVRALTDVR